MKPRLGIVVLIRNRSDYALAIRAALRLYTDAPFDLIFCVEGRADAAAQADAYAGENVFKNATAESGLTYLEANTDASVFVVLQDHWMPTNFGWEREGIEGAVSGSLAIYGEGAIFQRRGVWEANEPFRSNGRTTSERLGPRNERCRYD